MDVKTQKEANLTLESGRNCTARFAETGVDRVTHSVGEGTRHGLWYRFGPGVQFMTTQPLEVPGAHYREDLEKEGN
eukprot:6299653-Alexandrium_andersonii.AAC.1